MNRAKYNEEVRLRWHGQPLQNALGNWHTFEEHHEEILAILRPYLRDCWCEDLAGKMHNPEGTLSAWLWRCHRAHWWIWDFCDHYQTFFLTRGLIAYCKQAIAQIEACSSDDGTPDLFPSLVLSK